MLTRYLLIYSKSKNLLATQWVTEGVFSAARENGCPYLVESAVGADVFSVQMSGCAGLMVQVRERREAQKLRKLNIPVINYLRHYFQ